MPSIPDRCQDHQDEAVSGEAARDVEALFREFYDPLCWAAYRVTGARESAQDVVHDVFLALWERWDTGHVIEAPRAYLYRAVQNRALNVVRARHRAPQVSIEDAHDVAEERAAWLPGQPGDELQMTVSRAIAQLPERCRLAFTLSREHGMSHAEIASALGVSVNTVETQIARAIARIRQAIDR